MADAMEKLEAAVRKLGTDMAEVRSDMKEHSETLKEHSEILKEHSETLAEVVVGVKQIQKTQVALTNAMTSAIKQLGSDKTLELRVRRLEDVVFGAKH